MNWLVQAFIDMRVRVRALFGRRAMRAAGDARQRESGDQPEPEPHGDEPHATFYHGRACRRARALRGFAEKRLRGSRCSYMAQSTQTLHAVEQGAVGPLPMPRSHCSPSASSTMPSPQKCGHWQPGAQPCMVP